MIYVSIDHTLCLYTDILIVCRSFIVFYLYCPLSGWHRKTGSGAGETVTGKHVLSSADPADLAPLLFESFV